MLLTLAAASCQPTDPIAASRQADILVAKYTPHAVSAAYRFGDTITFGRLGNSAPFQKRGWSTPEEGYTWTLGSTAVLLLPVEGVVPGNVSLKMRGWPLLFGPLTSQRVEVRINDQAVGQWVLATPGVQEITLDVPEQAVRGTRQLELTLELPDAKSPAEIGFNKDDRVLGVAFTELRFQGSTLGGPAATQLATAQEDAPLQRGGVDPRAAAATYRFGDAITFGRRGNSAPFQRDGWSTPEEGYTWTLGTTAALALAIDGAPPGGGAKLTLRGWPLLFGELNEQRVDVQVNGEPVGRWVLAVPGVVQETTLDVPERALRDRRHVELSFELLDATTPAEIGYNADARVLAVAFTELRFHA
jgi:hypothetical protein